MVLNSKCENCKEQTKYVVGFFDGEHTGGCMFDCKNEKCEVYQMMRVAESDAVQKRIQIQNLNGQKGMYAGHISALRKEAGISMRKMAEIAGCSPAEYSAFEHERKEFDPEAYQKCKVFLENNKALT